ncbi:DUF2269 domain-containing protein [Plantactinospora sp. DSM 117369]
MMGPRLRRFALTAHVTFSVGWLGAVLVFVVLAAVGLANQDTQLVRAAYLAMEPVTWYALVPLSIASLVTGIVQASGTSWGLTRHYWVLFKLILNILATAVLLMYTQTVGHIAQAATDPALPGNDLRALGTSPLLHGTAALLLLLVATILSVYKPRGAISYRTDRRRMRRGALALR